MAPRIVYPSAASSSAGASSNLWAAPSSPHADDDEFTSDTSANWTISGSAATVEAGTPDPIVTVAEDKHRRSFNSARASWLMLQPDDNATAGSSLIYDKAHTFATNEVVWCRIAYTVRASAATAGDSVIGLSVYATSTGAADVNNNVRIVVNRDQSGLRQFSLLKLAGGSLTNVVDVSYGNNWLPPRIEYLALRKVGGSPNDTWYAYAAGADGSWISVGSTTFAASTGINRVALDVRNKVAGPHMVMGFDFVRFATALP